MNPYSNPIARSPLIIFPLPLFYYSPIFLCTFDSLDKRLIFLLIISFFSDEEAD